MKHWYVSYETGSRRVTMHVCKCRDDAVKVALGMLRAGVNAVEAGPMAEEDETAVVLREPELMRLAERAIA